MYIKPRVVTCGQLQCLECSSDETRLQSDCSMVELAFCWAITSPSEELEWQTSSASGSDTASNHLRRPSQEVLRYEIRRLSIRERKGGENVYRRGVATLIRTPECSSCKQSYCGTC